MANPLSFELPDKVIVVTGAGRGIGKAIAEACAHYGADLALGSRTVEESLAVAEACRRIGAGPAPMRGAEAWALDVSLLEIILIFVDQGLAHYDHYDVLGINVVGN